MNIKELRQSGTKVKVEHYRYTKRGQLIPYSRKTKGSIAQRGGVTIITVVNQKGDFSKGVALCSKDDQFSYSDGVDYALERAMDNLPS